MNEFFHLVEHTLGLCGEKHPTLLALISEWPSVTHFIQYLKTVLK